MLVRWAARRVKEKVIGSLIVDGYPLSGMLSEIADQTSRHTSEMPSLADQDSLHEPTKPARIRRQMRQRHTSEARAFVLLDNGAVRHDTYRDDLGRSRRARGGRRAYRTQGLAAPMT
ncbi:MAG TPA: hypothetical protein VKA58_10065 [Propionibacteriaceae bacterium]|nr:hypothetical protein [Propionibacteriaceae bacterium]